MIDILMATYNGEKFIEKQIESILNQTETRWKLYIRDDGSTDNTINIIKKYTKEYPDKIIFIEDQKNLKSAKLNFATLLSHSTSDYIMFCDQDDIWIKNKIELTFNSIKEEEDKYGKNTPILIHTDLTVIDSKENIINESFFNFIKLNPKNNSFNRLLFCNTVTGCTMMINKPLLELSKHIDSRFIMHDHWIALVSSCFGIIKCINKPTVLYRQHESNVCGAKNNSIKNHFIKVLKKTNSIKQIKQKYNAIMYELILQAKGFKACFEKIPNDKLVYLNNFIELEEATGLKKFIIIRKNKFFAHNFIIGFIQSVIISF